MIISNNKLLFTSDNNCLIYKVLQEKKCWEPGISKIYELLLNNINDVFIDIGSNIGYHAINASRLLKNGKVYAFEPQPEIIFALEIKVKLLV